MVADLISLANSKNSKFMTPQYDLDKIKFSTDGPTFERAVGLIEKSKVTEFKKDFSGFSAMVLGTEPYQVSISAQHHDRGDCTCYLGREDVLCKHMVAVAIYAVTRGGKLTEEDKRLVSSPVSSGKLGELEKFELLEMKKAITVGISYIKAYSGLSRTWFAYQNSLQEGCNRLSKLMSDLPVGVGTARLLVDMLLRLDKKLSRGGIDDSDGVVGGFIEETVCVLQDYTRLEPKCAEEFTTLKNRETCFGWEEPLVKLCAK